MTESVLSRSNPFPSYPVMKLGDRSTNLVLHTGETEQVVRVRRIVTEYASTWSRSSPVADKEKSLFIPVQGDFGSGKTHLVKYATALLAKELEAVDAIPRIVVAPTTEVDCWSWYRTVLGPALVEQIDPPELLTRVLAKAAVDVAKRASLTEGLTASLEATPTSVFDFLSKDKLNVTEVLERFEGVVRNLCRDAGDAVTHAFMALPWSETRQRALQFLKGATLGAEELASLKLVDPLASEDDATRVIVGLASVCAFLRSPFVMAIDEFEHLARYDAARSARNATWTKRLLENLADYGPFVLISGHWSAWKQKEDFGHRFSRQEVVRLVNIGYDDVLKIVDVRVPTRHNFGVSQAQAVARLTGGRMRHVMGLLASAFRASDEFKEQLSDDDLRRIADDLGQRITLDTAKIEIHAIFERMRLTVSVDPEMTRGIPFTIAGLMGQKPRVVAKLRHVSRETDYIDQTHEFRVQVDRLREEFPDVVGLLLADGNVDRDYMTGLGKRSGDGLLYYDLRDTDVLASIEADLQRELIPAPRRVASPTSSGDDLDAIEQHRKQEQAATMHRIQIVSGASSSPRHAAVLDVVEDSKRRFDTYRELSERPGAFRRISLLPPPTLAISGILIALLILAIALRTEDLESLGRGTEITYPMYMGFMALRYAILGIAPLLVAFVLWRSLSRIDRFTAFSTRVLRELYVREVPEQELVRASNILQNALDSYGPYRALHEARRQLREAFSDLDYLRS